MPETYPFCLGVRRLRLAIHLGVGEAERRETQDVEIDLRLYFDEWPDVCDDESRDFLCYDDLAQVLHEYVGGKEFRLIEFLGARLFEVTRAHLGTALPDGQGQRIRLWLDLHKCRVPTPGVMDGTGVTLTDLPGGLTCL